MPRDRDPTIYLRDMLESATIAMAYLDKKSLTEFTEDRMVQDAVIRRIEIIGEAAKRVDKSIQAQFTDHEWSDICGMRDILIHQYGAVDVAIVYETVIQELPKLVDAIRKFLESRTQDAQEGQS